jgi:branched-chain amino acid transport system substrate-binding protein
VRIKHSLPRKRSHVKEINAVTRTTVILASLLATTALTVPAGAADPIKIGVVTPLSGTYTPIGQQVKWGLELATKEVNAAGGIMGRQVELIFEDEEANPSVAVQKAEKLFEVQKVDFLTGTGQRPVRSYGGAR